jgi:hypothetical protein
LAFYEKLNILSVANVKDRILLFAEKSVAAVTAPLALHACASFSKIGFHVLRGTSHKSARSQSISFQMRGFH